MSAAVDEAGARAVEATIARLAERLRAEMPEAAVVASDDTVAVTGRGLIDAAPLRWSAGLLR